MHPSVFKARLKAFDPRLDFVWNGRDHEWQVIGTDLRKKKYLIYKIPLGMMDKLGPWIIEELWKCTPHRQGGAKEVNRRIDEDITKQEEAQAKETKDAFDAVSDEVYETWQRRDGERINSAGAPWVVRDKRRFKPEAVGASAKSQNAEGG